MNKGFQRLAGIVAAAAFFTAPVAVNAFVVDMSTPMSETFDVSWELMGASPDNPVGTDLSGNASFEFLGFDTLNGESVVRFGLTITNTTPTDSHTSGMTTFNNIHLAAFGFGTDPNTSVISWNAPNGGADGESENNQVTEFVSFDPLAGPPPSGAPDLNDPAEGSPLECKQNPANVEEEECADVIAVTDLGAGESDSFEFVLGLDQVVSASTQVSINPFAAAYDYDLGGIGGGSKPDGYPMVAANETNNVPMPAPLLLLAAGFFAIRRFSKH